MLGMTCIRLRTLAPPAVLRALLGEHVTDMLRTFPARVRCGRDLRRLLRSPRQRETCPTCVANIKAQRRCFNPGSDAEWSFPALLGNPCPASFVTAVNMPVPHSLR
jgi:hypothetical protein